MFKLVVIEKIDGNTLISKIKDEIIKINIDDDDKQIMELGLKEGNNIISVDKNNDIINDEKTINRFFPEMNNE